MPATVAEIARFRLKSDADAASFVQASQPVDAFCRTQAGFVSRRLMRDETGGWIDYIEWADGDAASQAAKLMPKAEGVGPFLSAIDMSTISMRHLRIEHSTQAEAD
ncbi:MAG: hypothetical protein ACXIVF_06080 [Rhizobiaceae bacterium]